MSNHIDFDDLIRNFTSGKISHESFFDMLNIIIERSDDETIRASTIPMLRFLKVKPERKFNILENALISDESPIVRAEAVKAIILDFPNKSIDPLKWTIKHDDSIKVLQTIGRNIWPNSKELLEALTERLGLSIKEANYLMKLYVRTFERLASDGIVPDDVKFFKMFQEAYQNYSSYKNLWNAVIQQLKQKIESLK